MKMFDTGSLVQTSFSPEYDRTEYESAIVDTCPPGNVNMYISAHFQRILPRNSACTNLGASVSFWHAEYTTEARVGRLPPSLWTEDGRRGLSMSHAHVARATPGMARSHEQRRGFCHRSYGRSLYCPELVSRQVRIPQACQPGTTWSSTRADASPFAMTSDTNANWSVG